MLKRVSIFAIGALFAFLTVFFIQPAEAAPCSPTTITSGMTVVVKFTTVGTCIWQIPANVNSVSLLVVAGGGGGGGDAAGGGGAGGVYLNTNYSVAPNAIETVTVGGGGNAGQCSAGGASSCVTPFVTVPGYFAPGNGGASNFDAITVAGGGAGGVYNNGAGAAGGSGGGGSSTSGAGGIATATGTNFYGNSGGTSNGNGGAGGGGAGTAGISAAGGNGGAGIASSITGSLAYYGGGGGGGNSGGTQGAGGVGGGGAGAQSCTYSWITSNDSRTAQSGAANTGGGGGGAPHGCQGSGGSGGSGVVIIAYTLIPTINSIALSSGTTTATYRTVNTLQVTLTSDGRVRFYVNGKQIPGCISVLSSSSISSCNWKPSRRGTANISARVVGGASTAQLNVAVIPRTNRR